MKRNLYLKKFTVKLIFYKRSTYVNLKTECKKKSSETIFQFASISYQQYTRLFYIESHKVLMDLQSL